MNKTDLTALYQRQVNELTMTVELLKGQLEQCNSVIRSLNELLSKREETIDRLTDSVNRLTAALEKNKSDLAKQRNINRGLGRIMGNRSEKVRPAETDNGGTPVGEMTEKELAARDKERQIRRKARGNNGAKHCDYSEIEVEEVVHDIMPDSPDFNAQLARLVGTYETCRFEYVPAKFIKHLWRLHKYSQNGEMLVGKLPQTPLVNSQFDGSFIAGVLELRYMYNMPENRIVSFFNEHGFPVKRSTVNGLLRKSASMLDGLYGALERAVLEDTYISLDETYVKILLDRPAPGGKHIKKGYLWDMIAHNLNLAYFFYENGSRKADIIYEKMRHYSGTIQSDGYRPYRELGSDSHPNITRLPCLQHIKREFYDMRDNPDAKILFDLLNMFYREEHKPKKEKRKNWTADKHARWREKYSKPILRKLREEIDRIKASPTFSVDKRLHDAVIYLDNEMPYIPNIFTAPDYDLDNNIIERHNRAVALSRHSSLFFGSHGGAKRGAMFHSLAASCRMNNVDFFTYITEILNYLPHVKPTSPYEVYRELLPDKWSATKVTT